MTTRQKRQTMTMKLPPIYIHSKVVEEVSSHKILGITLDNNLSWCNHVDDLCKKVSVKVFQLSKIKHFLNMHARKLFFQAHIQSTIDYASTLWDSTSANTLKPLVSLHKRALKLIILKTSTLNASDYKTLDILPLKNRLKYNKGLLMYKIMSGNAPPNLTSSFSISSYSHYANKINLPIPRIDLFKSSLKYSGTILWNTLPESLKTSGHITFKTRLHTHLSN